MNDPDLFRTAYAELDRLSPSAPSWDDVTTVHLSATPATPQLRRAWNGTASRPRFAMPALAAIAAVGVVITIGATVERGVRGPSSMAAPASTKDAADAPYLLPSAIPAGFEAVPRLPENGPGAGVIDSTISVMTDGDRQVVVLATPRIAAQGLLDSFPLESAVQVAQRSQGEAALLVFARGVSRSVAQELIATVQLSTNHGRVTMSGLDDPLRSRPVRVTAFASRPFEGPSVSYASTAYGGLRLLNVAVESGTPLTPLYRLLAGPDNMFAAKARGNDVNLKHVDILERNGCTILATSNGDVSDKDFRAFVDGLHEVDAATWRAAFGDRLITPAS